ncbi:MAG: bis(5'-nucleosyl)-tetraphosphatase (symmetrical) YqeK [Candidatus Hydrogenedentes bacterium]|nr:bis(5'-nucleosyl)-tetraphosphatase (symmetrical) YqeK [Candidatus Hydrogenedentota bacterium]
MLRERLQALDSEWRQVPRAVEFERLIEERLGANRVRHSISVTKVLHLVAGDLGLDTASAVSAGLLHDSCKAMKNEAMLETAERYGIPLNETHMERPNLLHGHVAAALCRHEWHVADESVCEAIAWHVTGHPGLGLLGQALFFADFSEPLREHPESDEALRIYDAQCFRSALRYAARAKLDHLRKKGLLIDPNTEAFCAWLDTRGVV